MIAKRDHVAKERGKSPLNSKVSDFKWKLLDSALKLHEQLNLDADKTMQKMTALTSTANSSQPSTSSIIVNFQEKLDLPALKKMAAE